MRHPSSILSDAQQETLKALVDALLPPIDVPEWEGADQHYYSSRIADPSRFWNFRLSYDPGFLSALEARLLALNGGSNEEGSNSQLFNIVNLLSSVRGTSTVAGQEMHSKFAKLSSSEQTQVLQHCLQVAADDDDDNKDASSPKQQKLNTAMNHLKQVICQTAFTYHPAMATTTAMIPVVNNGASSNSQAPELYALNPFWKTMRYPGSAALYMGRIRDAQAVVAARNEAAKKDHGLPPLPLKIQEPGEAEDATTEPTSTSTGNTLECDVVVVGSGAAGSVAASVLAEAGFHVIVIEEGKRPTSSSFGGEQEADRKYQQDLHSTTSNIRLIRPRAVGGSTEFHNGNCALLPPNIRYEWANNFGLLDFNSGGPYDKSLKQVLGRLQVKQPYHINRANYKLRDACIQQGYRWQTVPQNLQPRKDQTGLDPDNYDAHSKDTTGYVGLGTDRYGQRETAGLAFLGDAAKTGNCELLDSCRVTRIEMSQSRLSKYPGLVVKNATGVVCEAVDGGASVSISARKGVILAAGAIETPLLLQKSGIRNPHLGKHLKLQPSLAVFGFADTLPPQSTPDATEEDSSSANQASREVDGFDGAAQTIYCTQTETDNGTLIQSTSLHPGWLASQLPWTTPEKFKDRMRLFRSCMPLLCTLKDQSEGSVHWDGTKPIVNYHMKAEVDRKNLLRTVQMAAKMQLALGAKEVTTAVVGDNGVLSADAVAVDRYLNHCLQMQGVESCIFSEAQSSSCRMSSFPADGVVDMFGEVWSCQRLFVMDASTFPSATLVNPMITVLAFAHLLSTKLAQRLRSADGTSIDNETENRAHEIEWVRAHHRLELNHGLMRKAVVKAALKVAICVAALIVMALLWWLDIMASGSS